VRAASAGVC